MTSRLQPTTVRLTDAEQTFLANLKIPGATTISDKIRKLIAERSRMEEADRDFGAALAMANSLLAPLSTAVKTAENETGVHSQLVRRLIDWAPELLATLLTESVDETASEAELRNFERVLSQQFVRALDMALQIYVARDTSLYDPEAFGPRQLASLQRLCRLASEDSDTN